MGKTSSLWRFRRGSARSYRKERAVPAESAAQTRGILDSTPDRVDVRSTSGVQSQPDQGEETPWGRHQPATTKDTTRSTPDERAHLPVGRPPSSARGFRRYAVTGPSSVRGIPRSSTSVGRTL